MIELKRYHVEWGLMIIKKTIMLTFLFLEFLLIYLADVCYSQHTVVTAAVGRWAADHHKKHIAKVIL